MFGKIETSKISRINRERKNTIIFALAVEVTTNITHINPQQTKMTKKNDLHQRKIRKRKEKYATNFSENKTI